jgi:hypothetical protein
MKPQKTIRNISHNRNQIFKIIRGAIVMGIGFAAVTQAAWAENSTPDKQNAQNSPVKKPDDGKGKLPTFAEADVNGDHSVTKKELQNFPYLLQVFDKVDAGHDGKLEQHEYQNLEMETKREGEVR